MCADQPRNRTVGCKMTDSEYEKLAGVDQPSKPHKTEWISHRVEWSRFFCDLPPKIAQS
jgi:hypothetical protein